MRSVREIALAGVLLAGSTVALPAQAVGFDVTRTWTECTRGAANACAALSVRTYGLSSGGSHVAIGLSNLQGTSLFDNMAGSLLNYASFTFAMTTGAQSQSGLLTGAGTGGASGAPNMNLTANSQSISLAAPGSSWNNTYYATVNDYYPSCTSYYSGHCTSYNTVYSNHAAPYNQSGSTSYGIAGANTGANYNQTTYTPTGATGWTYAAQSYTFAVPYTYSYSCGWWSTCYGTGYNYYTGYNFNQYQYLAGVNNTQATQEFPNGATPVSGATFWFEFESENLYNAANIQYASFGSFNTQNGQMLKCDGNNQELCQIYSDQLVNNMPTSTVPEPISMTLMATGIAGVGFMRRRRARSGK